MKSKTRRRYGALTHALAPELLQCLWNFQPPVTLVLSRLHANWKRSLTIAIDSFLSCTQERLTAVLEEKDSLHSRLGKITDEHNERIAAILKEQSERLKAQEAKFETRTAELETRMKGDAGAASKEEMLQLQLKVRPNISSTLFVRPTFYGTHSLVCCNVQDLGFFTPKRPSSEDAHPALTAVCR